MYANFIHPVIKKLTEASSLGKKKGNRVNQCCYELV